MRLPRFRFTMRWTMGVVAFVALVLGGIVQGHRWIQQRRDYLRLVDYHARELRTSSAMRAANRDSLNWRKREEYHAALRLKYEAAAARPWKAVPPDDPEPTFLGY